jgi:dihydrofolate reductase
MSQLTVTTFVTLDGVMQAPGGPDEDRSGGFTHGGWLVPHFDDETGAFMGKVFKRADAFLLGRHTYEIFAAHWPHITDSKDPVATALNNLPKHVASSSLREVTWNNSELLRDAVPVVKSLKDRYKKELQVHGSGKLARPLLDNDLVDELNLLVFPVVLGTGQKLFEAGAVPTTMKLAAHRVTKNGIVICTFHPSGRPTYGSFMLGAA